ncbi:dihydroflavonol-4-reductase [Stella humosa]|uniref:Dihydroflavonol-4-reductase n=1 Tax=Stella humosa TaxID=94 RepID=A0A3N1KP64_9PROT|nr:hopanoid-associated sugar epimerase [Stella humosa]ROP81062.1 dihydroflavonol-4-reductase [Stella humosa]BBK29752.1 NAD-dependent dehydratase [Stella humosa]
MTGPLSLVTGGTGFVGAAVVRELLAHGHRVRALVRPDSDRRNLAGLDVVLCEGRLEDRPSLERAIAGVDALFHVAADYRLWAPDPTAMMAANVDGTVAIMEAALAAGTPRIVHTSSIAVLGHPADGSPGDEDTPVALADMIGPYKRSKFLAEAAVSAMVRERGLPAVIVNPAAPVGPRDIKPTPTGRMVLDAARGRLPAYVRSGLNIVHVEDVAIGHRLAFERGEIGQRHVLGAENLSLGAVIGMAARLGGRRPPAIRLPIAPLWPLAILAEAGARLLGATPPLTRDLLRMARQPMHFSHAKATARLGYRPRPAIEGLADAVAWFRANGYMR